MQFEFYHLYFERGSSGYPIYETMKVVPVYPDDEGLYTREGDPLPKLPMDDLIARISRGNQNAGLLKFHEQAALLPQPMTLPAQPHPHVSLPAVAPRQPQTSRRVQVSQTKIGKNARQKRKSADKSISGKPARTHDGSRDRSSVVPSKSRKHDANKDSRITEAQKELQALGPGASASSALIHRELNNFSRHYGDMGDRSFEDGASATPNFSVHIAATCRGATPDDDIVLSSDEDENIAIPDSFVDVFDVLEPDISRSLPGMLRMYQISREKCRSVSLNNLISSFGSLVFLLILHCHVLEAIILLCSVTAMQIKHLTPEFLI